MGQQDVRIEEYSDFQQQQIALPLDLGSEEHVLQRIRLEAESALGVWYELLLGHLIGSLEYADVCLKTLRI